MAALPIRLYPDEILRTECKPVEMSDRIATLIDDMLYTMYEAPGIGLAAPQVGEDIRVLVADVSEDKSQPIALVNPEIVDSAGVIDYEEGCLSLPGVYAKVRRPSKVKVRGLDRDGKPVEIEAEDLLAVCLQHEIDHLNGVLFIDHLSALKRNRLMQKYRKELKQRGDA
ncbi:peptide deformylase [Sulfurivirga caldicuralii]|uniref:Peptide deformylase n=1 Tax=Sulfurivirga caldicuralii TaxID=364032 RepID=A0A1N6DIX6_9GAMM|nr:peptide deformylase [Sulfurivirga caldicuralii]SIN70676.1 peptide deformylase [Sulfurivirga caldicuralii]